MGWDEKIKALATLDNARAHAETQEKFVYCVDLLEISAQAIHADGLVNRLEDAFEEILKSPPKKYNHAFSVAFTVVSSHQDGHNTPYRELLAGMARRLGALAAEEDAEAFDCYDTYEEE